MRQSFGPAARNDIAYILQLSAAVAELQRIQTARVSLPAVDYVANTPNEAILVDATAGAVSVSLPDAKGFYGQRLFVKKMDASGNAVTLTPQGSETIDGAATKSLASRYAGCSVLSTGTEWVVL